MIAELGHFALILALCLALVQGIVPLAGAEFEQALGTLRSAPESTGIIATGLASAELQWAWFSSALEVREGQFFPLIVADAAEKILAAMEQVTAAYAALPAP